ncbi:hypothetical protein KJ612_09100 [Myxococcota bacterium]|nr:hypothetical protein [Myxococcota bacterium]
MSEAISTEKKMEVPDEIQMRSVSDVRAYAQWILDKKSRIVKSRLILGDIVELVCELPRPKGASVVAPDRSFSLLFPLSDPAAASLQERYLKRLKIADPKTLIKKGAWDAYREETDLASHFGLSGPLVAAHLKMFIFTTAPNSEAVLSSLAEIGENLKKKVKVGDWHETAQLLKPTWLGPAVMAGALAVAALILGFFVKEPLYSFGKTSSSGLPNLVVSAFFVVLAVLAMRRRIAIAYLFLLLTEVATILEWILGLLLGASSGNWGGTIVLLMLLNFFLLAWIPLRKQDFLLFSFPEFVRRITLR